MSGQSSEGFVETTVRVRYAETDQMGVAHHASYFVWFELARTEFCRKHGLDYRDMEAKGYFLPVVEIRCRYRQPARYDDEVTIRAHVVERRSRSLRMAYAVRRGGDLLATGETLQMLTDADGHPRSFPADAASIFDLAIREQPEAVTNG